MPPKSKNGKNVRFEDQPAVAEERSSKGSSWRPIAFADDDGDDESDAGCWSTTGESAQHKAKKEELKKARKCSLNVSFQPETEPPAAAGEAGAASGASEAAWIWPYDNGLCDHKCDCFCGECCGLPRYHDHGNPERHLCKLHMQDSEDYGNARHMWIKYRDPAPPQRCWWCPPIGSKEAWFYETDPRSGWLQFRDPQSNCLWWWSWRNGDFFLEPGRR